MNPNCSQLHPINSMVRQPTAVMVRGWTCQQTEWQIPENIFRCEDIQPTCPLKPDTTTSRSFPQTRNGEKRAYQQRVQDIEQSSFTPLVFSATGGMGAEATTFYKRLATLLSQKWETPYSKTLCWLRCRLSFSLIRSAIQALRGARSSRGHAAKLPLPIDLVSSEAQISLE